MVRPLPSRTFALRKSTGLVLGGAALVALSLGTACAEPEPPPLHTITFTAFGDPDEPLPGVVVTGQAAGQPQPQPLGTTDASGTLRINLRAPYGTQIAVTATCPPGHRAPQMVPSIALHPVRSLDPAVAARGIEHSIQCLPEQRDAVVIVRATGAPQVVGIPVLLDGREVARTDEAGVAHIAVSKAPNSSFRLELAAASISPYLQPQQPAHDFTVPDEDVFLQFEQTFSFAPPPPPRRRVARPRTPVLAVPRRPTPIRIGGRR
ncbi:MAG: hypothetical protein OHK0013_09480 [Sandaracinaceae bacterium]